EWLPGPFMKRISQLDTQSPVTKINVAVDRLPNFRAAPNVPRDQPQPHHQCSIHLNCEDTLILHQAFEDAKGGLPSQRPMIELCIPSSLDPTLAPPGCHVVSLFTQYTPYTLAGGKIWDEQEKNTYADKVFDCIEAYAPGFKSSVLARDILTPPDLERIFGLPGGMDGERRSGFHTVEYLGSSKAPAHANPLRKNSELFTSLMLMPPSMSEVQSFESLSLLSTEIWLTLFLCSDSRQPPSELAFLLRQAHKLSKFCVKVVSFTKHVQDGQKLYLNMESTSGLASGRKGPQKEPGGPGVLHAPPSPQKEDISVAEMKKPRPGHCRTDLSQGTSLTRERVSQFSLSGDVFKQ
ncbi:hypothetical protein STEG23_028813, partial [Scotinomys teguina]